MSSNLARSRFAWGGRTGCPAPDYRRLQSKLCFSGATGIRIGFSIRALSGASRVSAGGLVCCVVEGSVCDDS